MQIVLLTVLLLLGSCSLGEKNSRSESADVPWGVSLKGGQKFATVPEISRNEYGSLEEFGPYPEETVAVKGKKELVPIVALILGPGINRVAGYISLLKAFEKKKVPIHIISGSGMGAIVAALYARGVTLSKIEWIFYRFWNKAKKHRPYKKKWLKVVNQVLLKDFSKGKQEIQDSKISLVLPVYDRNERQVRYFLRGFLYKHLITNLVLYNTNSMHPFSTPFQWEVYNGSFFSKMGADIVIGADVLSKGIDFKSGDEYLIGVFGNVAGRATHERETLDLFFELPITMPLDSLEGLPHMLKSSMVSSKEIADEVLVKIDEWQASKRRKK